MATKKTYCAACLNVMLVVAGLVSVYLLLSTESEPKLEFHGNHENCRFTNSSHGVAVICKNRGLSKVPQGLPREATVLDLSQNNLTVFYNESFKDVLNLFTLRASLNPLAVMEAATLRPLEKLRTLILASCNLQTLSPVLFIKNKLLTKLDLGRNQLDALPCEALAILPRLSEMAIDRNRVQSLDFDRCSRWRNLKKIDLLLNVVEEIHQNDFLPLQNVTLTSFSLASNKIRNLPKYAFYHLNSLQVLRLDGNHINSFDIQPFLGMAYIKELALWGCKIHHLLPPDNSSNHSEHYPSIPTLQMRENMIQDVPAGSFWGFTKVLVLHLNRNKIRTLDNQSFCQLLSLSELDISYNKIVSLPHKTFACLPNLERLNISSNEIRTVSPQSFNGMPSVTLIFLSHNKIEDLNSDNVLWTLKTLQELDLSYNNLQTISRGKFSGLSNLQELNLSFNPIGSYSSLAFVDLVNLKKLFLSNQNLIFLQDTFQQLHTVLLLDLSNTRVTILRDSLEQFFNMTHLQELRMEKAQLADTDLYDVVNNQSIFAGLLSLKKLRLKGNYLVSLDYRVFHNLSKLYYLHMTDCRMQVLRPEVLHPLTSLVYLHISENKLVQTAGDTFHGLYYLRVLSIENNNLRGLEVTTFAKNPRLIDLLLSGNQISTIKPGTVLPSNTSLRLDMSRNPFTCTCSLTWFRQWLASADVALKHADQTLCSGTSLKKLANQPIMSFHPKDHCGVNIILIVVLSFTGVLVGMVALLTYKKRWWLNHKIFLLKLAIVGYEEMAEDFNAENYRYHLNLMFQEEDQEWVDQVMKPALEERLPHLQNIIFGDEDLHLGMYYIEALYDAIDNSFKTVLLLSNQSVNDAWTMTKLRMALEHINDTGLDKIILIFVEEIDDDHLPYLVRLFLSRNKPYMLWTDDEDAQELFWAQFEKSMRANRAINNAIPL